MQLRSPFQYYYYYYYLLLLLLLLILLLLLLQAGKGSHLGDFVGHSSKGFCIQGRMLRKTLLLQRWPSTRCSEPAEKA